MTDVNITIVRGYNVGDIFKNDADVLVLKRIEIELIDKKEEITFWMHDLNNNVEILNGFSEDDLDNMDYKGCMV